jgi:hypothetical protein
VIGPQVLPPSADFWNRFPADYRQDIKHRILPALNGSEGLAWLEGCPDGRHSPILATGSAQWGVAVAVGVGVLVGWLVGVWVAVGELLAVTDGLGVTWLVGVGDGWPGGADGGADGAGVGEGGAGLGVAAGWLLAAAATSVGWADGAAAAIMIPATIATMPAMPPAASNTGIQEE